MSHPEVYILRHGQTEWNAIGRMQGWLDSPLTDQGKAQAARQRDILREAGAGELPVYCSTSLRAVATAAIALPGTRPRFDPRLREITLGAWDGRTVEEILATSGDAPAPRDDGFDFWWYDSTPGERFAGVQARIQGFASELNGPAVVVTHGMTSRFLRGALLGLEIEEIADLPGGQGVVYHLKDGTANRLT